MPLFHRMNQNIKLVRPKGFANEKELQNLVESNLKEIFNCKFIASEFSTGSVHGGRIDTLALSEDNNPVIIEYKVVESSQLINQSLYYLSWLFDHRGDYEVAVQKALSGNDTTIDWSSIRVICIAPDYKKYDLHAVEMMGSNIELWQYRYFENGMLLFEEIFKKSLVSTHVGEVMNGKNPKMVEAGKKAAITRQTGVYRVEEHMDKIDKHKLNLAKELEEYILGLDESIEEAPKKYYIAFKVSQNFVCMEIHKSHIFLYLKINPAELSSLPNIARDVTNIGHFGTGDLELRIKSEGDIPLAKEYIQMAFTNIGGT